MSFQSPASKLPHLGTTIFSVMSNLAHEHGAINLAQGFPDFDCDPHLKNLVTHYMERGFNQYAPMPGIPELREILAAKIYSLYGRKPNADTEITITAGATQAIFTAITALISPGDEVILIEPAYDCYAPAVLVNGGKVVPYPLGPPDYRIDWDQLGSLISSKTRMIIINNPHNPTGMVMEPGELDALYALIRDTDITVLSDEVYEHLVFDGKKHLSILGHSDLYERSLATFSFGKTFHNTGWKMGYAAGSEKLMKEFRKVHQFNVFSVNTPLQYGLADYLSNPSNYNGLGDFYEEKRDLFAAHMKATPFKSIPCGGTYFQLFDYRAISDISDVEFARKMTIDYGVATIPVSVFYTGGTDHKVVRFCFAKKPETLQAAGERIARSL